MWDRRYDAGLGLTIEENFFIFISEALSSHLFG